MMNLDHARDRARRVTEAAAWRIHLTEIGVETTGDFEAWLAENGNAEIWTQTMSTWDFFGEQSSDPVSVAARQAALGNAKRANRQLDRPKIIRRAYGAAAAAVLTGAIMLAWAWWLNLPDYYLTAISERRIIALSDGSKISLDANSEVTVRYTKTARELQLLLVQARFDVAHDVERPFSVLAKDEKIIATGTAFNVDIAGAKVLVTLIEGQVVILDEALTDRDTAEQKAPIGIPHAVELHAGQQLAALPKKLPEIAPVNVQRVTAWTNGQLMFDDEALTDVVSQVNRYTTTPIVIKEQKISALKLSGVFNTGDIPTFIAIVTHYLPVEAVTDDRGTITLQEKK